MKRCPECRRDYYDETLLYCLEDGVALVQGSVPVPPSSTDEPATAILPSTAAPAEAPTRAQIHTTEQTAVLPKLTQSPITISFSRKKTLIVAALGITLVAALGIGSFLYFGRGRTKQIESIAVMPFVNESGNPDVEYLSDGMTETLIKSLSNIPNVNVKARSSVFRYKGRDADLKKVAAELGVQAVLNGRITQRGDDIALTLELVEAATENVLWTERYTRKQTELAVLQSEIAKDVVNNLRAKLSPAEQDKVVKGYTANAEAFQLYLKGQYVLNKATPEAQKQSLQYFDQAVTIDPNFALAYSAKADAYTLLGTVLNAQMTPEEAMRNARAAAENALRLDPALSEAFTSRAWIKFRFDWDWVGAEDDFKRALALDPRNAHAHHWYGEFLTCMARHDEGIAELRSARDLEPFSPIISWNLGKNLFIARRYDEAMAEFQKTLEIDSNFSRVFRFTSLLYERKGMIKEAFDAFLKQPEVARLKPDRLAELKNIFESSGLNAARRKAYEWVLPDASTSAQRALAYVILNEKQKALDALEDAYLQRNGSLVGLYTESSWDDLRDEPRFNELVKKMNFPK